MIKHSLTALLALSALAVSVDAFSQASKVRSPADIISQAPDDHWRIPDPDNLLYIELERGNVIVELAPQFAPNHVQNIKALVQEYFYNGLNFYRVIEGFVAQGGDISGEKKPTKGKKGIAPEFTKGINKSFEYTPMPAPDGYAAYTGFKDGFPIAINDSQTQAWITHCTGVLGMARGNELNSGGTEFFITLNNQRYLDHNITVFGKVLTGMDLLLKLQLSKTLYGDVDLTGKNQIRAIRLGSDVPLEMQTPLRVLRTDSSSFRELISSRMDRPNPWFIATPGYVDVCSMPVPVELIPEPPVPENKEQPR